MGLLGPESGLGLFEQAASVEYSYFDPPFKNLAYEKIFKRFGNFNISIYEDTNSVRIMGHGEPSAELVTSYERQLRECLDYYEVLLAKQTYLAGNVRPLQVSYIS